MEAVNVGFPVRFNIIYDIFGWIRVLYFLCGLSGGLYEYRDFVVVAPE
jgi:uncharacterized membrane protein YuzA (DUF378 family)